MAKIQDTPQHIIVHDPEGKFWDGGIVESQMAHQLRARGVVTLPCVPALFRMSGVGGFQKRSWGGGLSLDNRVPSHVAPLTLFCTPEFRGLTWCARIIPSDNRPQHDGLVRFVSDSGQRIPTPGSYTELLDRVSSMRDLKEPDEDGGWTIGGEGIASVGHEGHYGFSLYAAAPGLRVLWVAAALAPLTA